MAALLLVVAAMGGAAVRVAGYSATSAAGQAAPLSVLDLQPFRRSSTIRIISGAGRQGSATLLNLHPGINSWYLLTVTWNDGSPPRAYHLENPKPHTRRLVLDPQYPSGLFIEDAAGRVACDLFGSRVPGSLEQARLARLIYSPVCDGRVYLRSPAAGHRTGLEAATEFFRDRVWGGEAMIGLGHQLLSDANREMGTDTTDAAAAAAVRANQAGPAPARVDPALADRLVTAPGLGISLVATNGGSLVPGGWYATAVPGTFVSVIEPRFIDPQVLRQGRSAQPLDRIESSSLAYLIAFDLARFDLGYARGTAHPALGWSDHMPAKMRDARLPGPDGISDAVPLVSTGLVAPEDTGRTVATFTAGFKRTHGAFLYGELSLVNGSSHYGFIENGIVFSRLQPGLSTILVLDDGTVEMKTWQQSDASLLPRIRHARQNGVPLVEFDTVLHAPVPGRLVPQWGPGNWSGSQDRKLRSMRSGAGIQRLGGRRYLVYAVFSSATPSAMARVFQAYGCDHAMLLDMNALEHTYLALYRPGGAAVTVEYLMTGMGEVDAPHATKGRLKVRFVGYPDNRDFFHVMRRDGPRGDR